MSITADPDALERVSGYVASAVESLPDRSVQLDQVQITKTPRREILTVPSRINYIGEAIALFDSGYSYHGSINVIRRYLSASFLWDQIRVQGGAYGAFCRFDPYSGVLILCSYRDPHVKRTLDVYASLADHLENLKISQDELEKTIVGCIGEQDPCELPDARGYSAFIRSLRGVDDQERQRRRDEVFDTSSRQFNELGALIRRSREKRSSVVLVDSGKIEELKTLLANPSVMSLL